MIFFDHSKQITRELWEIRVTNHGPALYDDKGDCHGCVSANKEAYPNNLSVFKYIASLEEERDVVISVCTRAMWGLNVPVYLDTIYMCDRRI